MNLRNPAIIAVLALAVAGPGKAQQQTSSSVPSEIGPVLMDNWNKGGCNLTDTIRFSLETPRDIGLVRTWIAWPSGVSHVSYTLGRGGTQVLQGEFGRNSCDTYQQSWCEGVATWNLSLEPGDYTITAALERICHNAESDGNGYLALYAMAHPLGASQPAPAARIVAPAPDRLGNYACYGAARYPEAWRDLADCRPYGCLFGTYTRQACLSLGVGRGASMIFHGIAGGDRENECWLQSGCDDLRAHPDFEAFVIVDSGEPENPARPVDATPKAPAKPLPTSIPSLAGEGFSIGDFSQRKGPFGHSEAEVGDFTNVFATTQGIIRRQPSGTTHATGHAQPGDVDVILLGWNGEVDAKIHLYPCSRSGRARVYDLQGRLLGQSGTITYGYNGLSNSFELSGPARGAYALVVDFPDGSTCEDGNGWSVHVSTGSVVDPIEFVGPFASVPDFSVQENLNVDDLIADLQAIMLSSP